MVRCGTVYRDEEVLINKQQIKVRLVVCELTRFTVMQIVYVYLFIGFLFFPHKRAFIEEGFFLFCGGFIF